MTLVFSKFLRIKLYHFTKSKQKMISRKYIKTNMYAFTFHSSQQPTKMYTKNKTSKPHIETRKDLNVLPSFNNDQTR